MGGDVATVGRPTTISHRPDAFGRELAMTGHFSCRARRRRRVLQHSWRLRPAQGERGERAMGGEWCERQIEIGGRQLVIYSAGSDGPSVVLIAGGGAPAAFAAPLQDRISRLCRVLSYDRAGLGESPPTAAPHFRRACARPSKPARGGRRARSFHTRRRVFRGVGGARVRAAGPRTGRRNDPRRQRRGGPCVQAPGRAPPLWPPAVCGGAVAPSPGPAWAADVAFGAAGLR